MSLSPTSPQVLTKLDKLTRDNLDHEVHELDTRSEPTLRYLKPMLVAESCLKCHKSQGYSLNDIRGAITVYVPMQNFLNAQAEQFKSTLFFHLIIWLIVPCAVYPFYKSLVKEADQSHQLNTELTDLNKSLDQKVIQRTKEIEKMATTDSLTGLKNRRCLRNIVNSELKRALRNKKTFVVAMFDIDNFKNYNDHYGHHQGDLALQSFAKIVKESLRRPADQAFRMGGEEFLICYTSDELSKIPELPLRILNSLQQQAIPNGKKVLTVSIGLTSCQPETTEINYEQLYKQADEALYIAKNNGKNQLRVYQSASTKKETNGTLLTSST
ncbi:MAG: diguanylate cyclase [Deltaproteobacteria bacterium]|nr:diguanylate cyclase [Deltaproteobacteria bacterium]